MHKPINDDYEPDAFVEEALDFMLHFDQYITRNYGARCPDYDADCIICGLWKIRDGVKEIILR